MVFAIAHVRGGEMGRLWYEGGKLLEKSTFSDFICAARHLVDTRLTRRRTSWLSAEARAAC